MTDATLAPALAQALNFSAEELALNRSGRLSERQQQGLSEMYGQTRAYSGLTIGLLGLILLAAAAFVAAGAWLEIGPLAVLADGSSLLPLLLIGTLAAVGIGLLLATARAGRGGDPNQGVVRQASGPADLRPISAGGGQAGELRIGRQSFYIPDKILQAFEQDQPYHVYYVKSGRLPVIVSAEPAA